MCQAPIPPHSVPCPYSPASQDTATGTPSLHTTIQPMTPYLPPDTVIISSDEPLGTTLRIEWGHNKWCEIQKTAHPDRYRVTASMNIKLQPADEITVPTLLLHNMFTATDCTRNNQLLGTYAGARKEGITAIIRLPLDTPHS